MTDVHTPEQRSFNMQQIKGKNTRPEMLVRKFLHANGYRHKLHDKRDTCDPKRFRLNLMTEKGTVPWDKHLQSI